MSDTQPTQNIEKEEKPELKEKSVTRRIGSFFIGVFTEGLGSAVGIAIVAFVAYTVVGVYQLQQNNIEMKETIKQLSTSIATVIEKQNEYEKKIITDNVEYNEKNRKLREEMIQSNQLALDMVIKEVNPSPVASTPVNTTGAPIDSQKNNPLLDLGNYVYRHDSNTDALKYRFRERQREIQGQIQ
jgi:uncharacterized protein HemX